MLRNLLHNILNPVKISTVLNKPFRRITLDIEEPSKSILDEETSERSYSILTHPFKIEVKRVGEKVSLFFSKLEDKLVFDFITALHPLPHKPHSEAPTSGLWWVFPQRDQEGKAVLFQTVCLDYGFQRTLEIAA